MTNAMTLLWSNPTRRRIEGMRPKLYRMAYAWCHDAHLAEDLAQESLTKALGHTGQLREAEAVGAWLFQQLLARSPALATGVQ